MRVHTDFGAAFTGGARFATRAGDERVVRVLPGGTCTFRGGDLAMGRAGALDEARVLGPIAPGAYPFEVALANDDEPAAARVRFSSRQAVAWELAVATGESPSSLGPGEFFGTYVGNVPLAVIGDASAFRELQAEAKDHVGLPPGWLDFIGTGAVAFAQPLDDGAELVVFSVPGPGTYAAYWGLDERGERVELVTDLLGLLENDYEEVTVAIDPQSPDVKLPLARPAGTVTIVGRDAGLLLDVTSAPGAELELRDFVGKRSREGSDVVSYELQPGATSVRAVAHYGLRRMKSLDARGA